MSRINRIKKLESFTRSGRNCAVFSINYYESEDKKAAAQENLIKQHAASGALTPDICVFICDIPGKTTEKVKEGFVSSFAA